MKTETPVEAKAKAIQSALCHLSRVALSDAFQVDVKYERNGAKVVAYPYNAGQASALHAFVKQFIWTDVSYEKTPFAGWVVTCTIKSEEAQ